MVGLLNLLRELDIYISQHAIYISKLERAISNKEPFEHKTCKDCAFGKKFYQEVYPSLGEYEEEIRSIILDIEKLHCEFHNIASEINTQNPSEEDLSKLNSVKELSTDLFQRLLSLKRFVLKGED